MALRFLANAPHSVSDFADPTGQNESTRVRRVLTNPKTLAGNGSRPARRFCAARRRPHRTDRAPAPCVAPAARPAPPVQCGVALFPIRLLPGARTRNRNGFLLPRTQSPGPRAARRAHRARQAMPGISYRVQAARIGNFAGECGIRSFPDTPRQCLRLGYLCLVYVWTYGCAAARSVFKTYRARRRAFQQKTIPARNPAHKRTMAKTMLSSYLEMR